MIPSKRRFFWRTTFESPAKLVTPEGEFEARVLDISLKGALLEIPAAWPAQRGIKCQLFINLNADTEIAMWCTAMHVEGLHVGLRCDNLDLDSITHLRRLVELNVGDPNILERDLASLINDEPAS
jgi:PilZ domain